MADFFEPALEQLADALPNWWATDPATDSELSKILTVTGELVDELAEQAEAIYRDQALATAGDEALRAEWALLYGVSREDLPLETETLRAYLQARAQEDGSLESLEETLLSLLRNPANDTGTELRFGGAGNAIVNPNFEHLSGATTGWATNATNGVYAIIGASDTDLEGHGGESTISGTSGGGTWWPAYPVSTDALATVTPTEWIGLSVRVKVTQALVNVDGNLALRARFLNGALGFLSEPVVALSPAIGSTYTVGSIIDLSGTVQVPASAAFAGAEVTAGYTGVATGKVVVGRALVAHVASSGAPIPAWSNPALTFPGDGSGLHLFQATAERGYLRFSADGTGLMFLADGSGIRFPTTSRLEIVEDFGEGRLEVYVRDYLVFDRPSFARAVARFRQAHMLPPTITETPT